MTMPISILSVSLLCRGNMPVRDRLDCTCPRGETLVPADSDDLQKFDSGSFLQDSGEAFLDRLRRLGRYFLSEFPKFPVLLGRGFEVLSALRG
jgi:hypothetical protein